MVIAIIILFPSTNHTALLYTFINGKYYHYIVPPSYKPHCSIAYLDQFPFTANLLHYIVPPSSPINHITQLHTLTNSSSLPTPSYIVNTITTFQHFSFCLCQICRLCRVDSCSSVCKRERKGIEILIFITSFFYSNNAKSLLTTSIK